MIVFHGLWQPGDSTDPGRFVFWGESTKRRQPLRRLADEAVRHPFAASCEKLRSALMAHLGTVDRSWFVRPSGVVLRLPSRNGLPEPSPSLHQGPSTDDEADRQAGLLLWGVPALPVAADRLVEMLLDVSLKSSAGLTKVAPDLSYWCTGARFALELLSRQRFLPALRQVDPVVLQPIWLPSLSDPADYQRYVQLAEAIPPVCRAQGYAPSAPHQPDMSPRKLVFQFLAAALDGLLRRWLAEDTQAKSRWDRHSLRSDDFKERWLAAVESGGGVAGSASDGDALLSALEKWTAGIAARPDTAAWRTCFRLEAPEDPLGGDERGWTLRFLVQAADDLSLLLPASQVWQEAGPTLRYLNRRFEQPQERLLTDLGRAAQLFPPIDDALREARPESQRLTTEEAHLFLREAAPLLEESGFGVLVPPWWERGGARARLGLKVKLKGLASARPSYLSADALVAYDWEMALGDQALTREEFDRLAKLKLPLVQVRGQWVELNPHQIERAIQFWARRGKQREARLADALRLVLGGGEDGDDLPVVTVETEGWFGDLVGGLRDDGRIEELPPPAGFQGELRPYQARGFSWLAALQEWGLGGCLADDMGLGKTIQLIALLLRNREDSAAEATSPVNLPKLPALLICPTSVVGNWRRELSRFAPEIKSLIHHGPTRLAGQAFKEAAGDQDLVVTSYALVHRDEPTLGALTWRSVVLDEAQNIKNPAAKQTQSIRRLRAAGRIALTGTPLENRLSELWSILEFLNPGYLGSAERFRRRFVLPIERWQDKERSAELRRLVQPFILRRLKTDPKIIQDLPDKVEMKQFCLLTREQATLYEAVVKDMMERIEAAEGIKRKGLVLVTLTRLKQVCNHPAHFLGDHSALAARSGKLARLEELLEELLAEGDRALIFTQFAEFGAQLQQYLAERFEREVLFLHGGVPAHARDRMVERFQQDDDGPALFLLSLKAGGLGLNLTSANHVFHFDRWWNPAVENQATDRVFRIGQHRNVEVHKFVCVGTVEERIDEMIEAKKALAESIIAADEGWLTELSTEQLRDIFALRREAVGDE